MIQVTFAQPEYISAGILKDLFYMTIVDPKEFYSSETLKLIAPGASDFIKAPRMMPNNEPTSAYISVNESLWHLSNASVISNTLIGVCFETSMQFLWGFINSL